MSARRRCTKWRASRSRPCTDSRSTKARFGLEQGQQVAETLLLAAVRGGGDQDQVPGGVGGEAGDQLVAEHPGPAAGAVGHAGVRLVDDQQVRAAVPELLAQPGALDEVGGHDDVAGTGRTASRPAAGRVPAGGSCRAAPARRRCRTCVASSRCHCSASAGPHSTARPVASPCSSSSAAIRPASMVLPMPTSSAISSRTVSCRSAISSGTSW